MKTLHFTILMLFTLLLLVTGLPHPAAADSECTGFWLNTFTLEYTPGFWTPGTHTYQFAWTDPTGTELFPINQFQSATSTPVLPNQVKLRLTRLQSSNGNVTTINPAQDTVAWAATDYRDDNGVPLSHQDAEAVRMQQTVQIRWDGGSWVTLSSGPLVQDCTVFNGSFFQRTNGRAY